MIIAMMALKGAVGGFYNLLTVLQTVSNTYAQVAGMQSCANRVQHIERLQHACQVVRRDSSDFKFERV